MIDEHVSADELRKKHILQTFDARLSTLRSAAVVTHREVEHHQSLGAILSQLSWKDGQDKQPA